MSVKEQTKNQFTDNLQNKLLPIFFILGLASSISISLIPTEIIMIIDVITHAIFVFYAIFYLFHIDKTRLSLNIVLLSCLFALTTFAIIINVSYFSIYPLTFTNYIAKFLFLCTGLSSFTAWSTTQKRFNKLYLPFLISVITYVIYFILIAIYNIIDNQIISFSIFSLIYICILISPFAFIFIVHSFANLKTPIDSKKLTVAFIASAGGHLTQITMLKPIFSRYNSFLITEKTPIRLKISIPIKYVIYCSRKQPVSYFFKSILNICRSIVLFAIINPDVIVTTGTHTAIPLCILGWIFRRKVIYIESFAKNSSPTMTGHFIYPFTDTFIIQWKNMKKFYPKAKYFGSIY